MGKVDLQAAVQVVPVTRPQENQVTKVGKVQKRSYRPDVQALTDILSERRGRDVDLAKVALKSLQTDFDSVYEEHRQSVGWELWDKRSPINDVPAETVLSRPEYASAESIYLLRINGRVTFFQPHLPYAEGSQTMDAEAAEWVAAVHAEELVERMTLDAVVEEFDSFDDLDVPTAQVDPNAIASAVVEAMGKRPRGARR